MGVDDIFSHVPVQLCQKIWANEYINLALLLKNSVELRDFFSSGVLHLTGGGRLEMKPESTAKDKVSNIEKWTDAFLIFSSIYLKRYPNKSQELLQYMSIIREAASRSSTLSWRSYDEQFRLRQALSVQSWGKINSDLWLRVMTSSTAQSTITNVGQTDLHTKGTCFDFNDGFCGRLNCKFSHVCSHCSASSHGRVTCFKAGYTSSNRGGPNFRRFRPSCAMLGASDLLQDVATGSSVRATATLQLGTTVSTKGQGDTTFYSLAKSPINLKNLCLELEGYDKEKAAAIRNGFTFGFPLHYSGPHMPSDAKI